jgi:hypothetical protein
MIQMSQMIPRSKSASVEAQHLLEAINEAAEAAQPREGTSARKALWDYCRRLHAIPGFQESHLQTATDAWCRLAGIVDPQIGEYIQFAYPLVTVPHGQHPMSDVVAAADQADPDDFPDHYTPRMKRLAAICRELQRRAGDRPFFISHRIAADHLDCDRRHAGRLIHLLQRDGILDEVKKGRGTTATRYRYTEQETRP